VSAAAPSFLVLGAEGQVGFELVRELAPLGAVLPLTRAQLDVADAAAVRAVVRAARPTVVVNAAAYTAVDAAETDAERCRLVNAVGPGVLAEEAERLGAALIHYSTDYVFDGESARPYTEADRPNPRSVYGATKLAGEEAVAAASTAHVVLRLSWVYGLRGRNFLRTMLRLAREREELRVVDDQTGAPTWSRMIAAATAQLLAGAARSPLGMHGAIAELRGVYHLSAGGATTWHGFAEALLAADPDRAEQRCRAVHAIATSEYPTPARRPAYSVLDNAKARARLGVWLPAWDRQLELALAR
jgi:dTDP-4-dehydrorhamnose reductase